MNDEPPKDLATRAFQKRVLDEFAAIRREQAVITTSIAAIEQRLTTPEERVDTRLKETGSVWEAVQEQLQRLVEKFDVLVQEYYEVHTDLKIHGRRIGELERRS
jgi:predicted  nucleic acid-binding Zn-ribbon protein